MPAVCALPGPDGCSYNAAMSYPLIFDRSLLRARRARAAALGPATFLLERAVDDLVLRLGAVLRRFDLALDPAVRGDTVRARLADRVGAMSRVDPLPGHPATYGLRVVADEEALPFRDGSL